MLVFLSVSASALSVALIATYLLAKPGGRFQILDYPNERSLHSVPISRTGGLAIWAGALVGIALALLLLGARSEIVWISRAAFLVGVVSFLDDRFHVSVGLRLLSQLLAVALILLGGLDLRRLELPGMALELSAGMGFVLTTVFIVWMINLYNFMDGMDGFAGGMTVFGFGVLGLLGYLAGDAYFAAICWVVSAATGGFLVWNFPPANIFMGDVGASVLGLMAGTMSLWGHELGLFPLWTAILVFSPFVADATVTLLRRVLRKERIWQAHRSHYYQRLVCLGWGHRKTVLVEYVLMIGCGLAAVLSFRASPTVQWLVLAAWVVAYAVMFSTIAKLETWTTAGHARE